MDLPVQRFEDRHTIIIRDTSLRTILSRDREKVWLKEDEEIVGFADFFHTAKNGGKIFKGKSDYQGEEQTLGSDDISLLAGNAFAVYMIENGNVAMYIGNTNNPLIHDANAPFPERGEEFRLSPDAIDGVLLAVGSGVERFDLEDLCDENGIAAFNVDPTDYESLSPEQRAVAEVFYGTDFEENMAFLASVIPEGMSTRVVLERPEEVREKVVGGDSIVRVCTLSDSPIYNKPRSRRGHHSLYRFTANAGIEYAPFASLGMGEHPNITWMTGYHAPIPFTDEENRILNTHHALNTLVDHADLAPQIMDGRAAMGVLQVLRSYAGAE